MFRFVGDSNVYIKATMQCIIAPDNSHLYFLNDVKIVGKEIRAKLPNTKIVFAGLIIWKDRKSLDKNVAETKKKSK